MAETITIPSPSVFLSSPVEPSPAKPPAPPKTVPKRTTPTPKQKQAEANKDSGGVTKRKQSKSRNGCVTCKAKRLKCDETKPTCQQCARRSVPCGGYKKSFKWRPFEESNFTGKSTVSKPKKPSTPPAPAAPPPAPVPASARPPTAPKRESPPQAEPANDIVGEDAQYFNTHYSIPQTQGLPLPQAEFWDPAFSPAEEELFSMVTAPFDIPIASRSVLDLDHFEPGSAASTVSMFNDNDTIDTLQSTNTAASSLSSGQSPKPVDLLNPVVDMSTPNAEILNFRAQYPDDMFQPAVFDPGPVLVDEVEPVAIVPQIELNPEHEAWVMRLPSPSPSSSSSSSSDGSAVIRVSDPQNSIFRPPQLSLGSPEMLSMCFDRQTCGILSIKDGPHENPWRTMIWPLARDSPALYHAIASLTSFHASKNFPQMRVEGIDHMRSSIQALASGIADMKYDTAIATTLTLAFSESWDRHISTGIDHIRGAKILVNQALVRHRQNPFKGPQLQRIKFLCHAWIYMDVIARLTSVDDDDFGGIDSTIPVLMDTFNTESELDPLMGCASTLFPIIGRVANLVRRVRKIKCNSPAIISQASELKIQLENWMPPSYVEDPEDPTSSVQHGLQTAEAYRWATLLYLHQAVPEIPSMPSSELAKKVLVYLATVPLSSRTVIVHIYPLTAAGCEAVGEEDRQWVEDRWEAMGQRMVLGIIDRCLEVVKEVWDRRDAYEARNRRTSPELPEVSEGAILDGNDLIGAPFSWLEGLRNGKRRAVGDPFEIPRPRKVSRRRKSSRDSITGAMDPEYTVRGSLHWLGVMKDWGWEVLLG